MKPAASAAEAARPSGPLRSGYVTILGEPNVGKSTLINAMLGSKISIVTNKPQTTRHRIHGILTKENSQAIILDTPGLLAPRYELQRAMMAAARTAIAEADILLWTIDCTSPLGTLEEDRREIFPQLNEAGKPVYLVINKIDCVARSVIPPIIISFTKAFAFAEVFPISALKRTGIGELVDSVLGALPVHPWYYPGDILSEQPERFFVSEIIREKIFEVFREEVPYSTSVEILEFTEKAGAKDVISAEIFVERDSQKRILIGSGARELKKVGTVARKDIEAFLGRAVFLQLHVRVREKWRDDPRWVKRFGYTP